VAAREAAGFAIPFGIYRLLSVHTVTRIVRLGKRNREKPLKACKSLMMRAVGIALREYVSK
jgi:hypothetical protein